jgi:putative ABC transport system permease protein
VTGKLVWENLKHRPMRSLLSILLISVPVTLILTLVGLSHGFLESSQERTRGIGADVIVRPPGSSFLNASGAPLLEDLGPKLLAIQPHVTLVLPVVNHPIENVTLGASGIDLDTFDQMSGGFQYIAGGPFRGPHDVIVDRYYASQHNLHVGETVNLLNVPWRVCGIVEVGKLAHVVFPIRTLQDITGDPNKVTLFYLKLDNPANTNEVVRELKNKLDGYPIYSMQEFTSLLTVNNIPELSEFINIVMGIGVIIGFAVVCLSMYMAVLQRTREIGILKSLGASKVFILRIILAEALLLGIGGTLFGIVLSYGAYWVLEVLRPASLPIVPVPEWWPIAGVVTLVGALLGALYPGLNAARHDPIEALSYE